MRRDIIVHVEAGLLSHLQLNKWTRLQTSIIDTGHIIAPPPRPTIYCSESSVYMSYSRINLSTTEKSFSSNLTANRRSKKPAGLLFDTSDTCSCSCPRPCPSCAVRERGRSSGRRRASSPTRIWCSCSAGQACSIRLGTADGQR